ncbi:hypothetical protein GIB67_002988, partial [Kingdonia uniflora]
ARRYFQQLIAGVHYLHFMSIFLHSRPKSTVGTPAYIAPEVFTQRRYDGKLSDVWSCGVVLYVMIVGERPFEDPKDSKNYRKTMEAIMDVQYKIPNGYMSENCKDLLSRIFEKDPSKVLQL